MLKKLEAANVESMSLLSMLRRTKVDLASRDTREVAREMVKSQLKELNDACDDVQNELERLGHKHYMDKTQAWRIEHDQRRVSTFEPLAKAQDHFSKILSTDQSRDNREVKWEKNTASLTRHHHFSDNVLNEVLSKLRAASYRYAGKHGHDFEHLFHHMDTDGDGRLSYEEFSHGLKKFCPLTDREMHAIFKKFDVDGSGNVEWVEFVSRLQGEPSPHKKKKKKNSNGPHYMDVTEDWVREHDMSVRAPPTLAQTEKSWEETLHGAKMHQGGWTLTTPHSNAHHVADNAYTEIVLKFRASAYGGPSGGQNFERLFKKLCNRQGKMTFESFFHAARKLCPITKLEAQSAFQRFDLNGNGEIELEEFILVLDPRGEASPGKPPLPVKKKKKKKKKKKIPPTPPPRIRKSVRHDEDSKTRSNISAAAHRAAVRSGRSVAVAQTPHYMQSTAHSRIELDPTVKKTVQLANEEQNWEKSLHGNQHQGSWKLTTPHSSAHHISKSALREVLCKLNAASFERGGQNLSHMFELMDTNHDGDVSREEFEHCVRRLCPITNAELDTVFRAFDKDGSGQIDVQEFLSMVKGPLSPDKAQTRAIERVREWRKKMKRLGRSPSLREESPYSTTFGSSSRFTLTKSGKRSMRQFASSRKPTLPYRPPPEGRYMRRPGWTPAGVFHSSPAKSPGEFWEGQRKRTRDINQRMLRGVHERRLRLDKKAVIPHRPKPKQINVEELMDSHLIEAAMLADKYGAV